jgi:hypothetical protein
VADGDRDQDEARERHAHPGELPARGRLSQDRGGEQDREEGLRLDGDRREPGRHPAGDAEELEQELPGEEREADRHERPPRDGRPREERGGHGGDEEPQGRKLRR